MKDLCRALDAEAAQARQAAWRACLSVRRLEDPSQRVPTQRTFTFTVHDWVGATRRQTYLRPRLNEPDTALAAHAALRPTCVREAFPTKASYHKRSNPVL